jgi:hypothetical protein
MPLSPDQWMPLANATNIFNTTTNSISTSSQTEQEAGASGIALAVGWILMILFCLCAKSNIPDERYHRHHRHHRRRSSRSEDPEARKERIEQSLAVKRVVTADAEGGLTLGDPLITETYSAAGEDASTSFHSMDENEYSSICVICLETFRVGDTVAWSKHSTISGEKADEKPCLHVFHRDCIVPWLENPKHDDCPSCRSIILQDIEADVHSVGEEINLEDDDMEAGASMPFVIMHGLVSRVRRTSYSLIGQSIEVAATDNVECDGDDKLPSMPQPAQLRHVFSLGERRPSISEVLRGSMRKFRSTSVGSHRDDDQTTPLSLVDCLYKPIVLRRVASAGPGSPASPTHRNEGTLHTDAEAEGGVGLCPSRFPSLRRTSSGIHARFSQTQDSIEEDLQVVRSSVSWRDLDQSMSDHTVNDVIIIEEV